MIPADGTHLMHTIIIIVHALNVFTSNAGITTSSTGYYNCTALNVFHLQESQPRARGYYNCTALNVFHLHNHNLEHRLL